MKTVYWSKYNVYSMDSNDFLLDLEPKPAYKHAKNLFEADNKSADWLECPASIDILSSNYSINSPIDLSFSMKHDSRAHSEKPHSMNMVNFRNFNKNYSVMDYLLTIHLFSEEDLEVSVTSPFLNASSNYFLIPGKFNISKWFRPINPSYMFLNSNYDVLINKGDPIMNLSFNTKEKILFQEFYFTETLKEIVKESVGYKQFSKKNSLFSLYSKFENQKINKIVLKEIKKSLI